MSEPERTEETEGVTVPRRRPAPESSKKGLVLVMALVGVGAGVVALALGGLKENATYSKSVDELVDHKARFVGRPVRAEGKLVPGTLKRRDDGCEYNFEIEKNGKAVPVRFAQCVVPDNFKDTPGMDTVVTVEGELKGDGHFEATTVLTKCPSKYEEKQRNGEKNPHLTGGALSGAAPGAQPAAGTTLGSAR